PGSFLPARLLEPSYTPGLVRSKHSLPAARRAGSAKEAPMEEDPLRQQQHHRRQRCPFPQIAQLTASFAGLEVLRAHLNGVARLDVALVGVQQVDREAALPAVP